MKIYPSLRSLVLTLIGAAVGGVVGYFGYWWLLSYGFFGLVLPGGLMGLGASIGRARSWPLAVLVGVAALGLGLFAEWQSRVKPIPSLEHFLTHLHELSPVTWLMLAVGTAIGVAGPLDVSGRTRAPRRD